MQVAGSAIERVLNPPIAPARRFGGLIDTALTLAFGSICAFGLTLGPAPLNTVAVSSAAAASFSGQLDLTPDGTALPPGEVEANGPDDADADAPAASTVTEANTVREPTTNDALAKAPVAAAPPAAAKSQEPPRPPAQDRPAPPPGTTSAAALTIVESHRLSAGLDEFVSAEACERPSVHTTLVVTPPAVLPPGLAKQSLAPDPAYATVSSGPGALSVTIHACE
jgi:hypothetical protein